MADAGRPSVTQPAVSVAPVVSTVTDWNTASSVNTNWSSPGNSKLSGTTVGPPGEIPPSDR